MKSQTRTLQKRSKQYAAQDAIDRLNSGDTSPACKRVERILELLVEAEHLRSSMYERMDKNTWEFDVRPRYLPHDFLILREFQDERLQILQADYQRCLGELHKRLAKYRWRFVVWDADYHWLEKVSAPDVGRKKDDKWEHSSVSELLGELQDGDGTTFYSGVPSRIARYRRCKNCSQWFYAQTEHQRFCMESCRKSNASKNDVFKEKRRLYMRKRRADEKAEEKRSLERARRGLGKK